MTRVLELLGLGFAGGLTFALAFLRGARKVSASPFVRAADPPINWRHLHPIDHDGSAA